MGNENPLSGFDPKHHDAAPASEQGTSVHDNALELTRANEAVRKGVAGLAKIDDLNNLLGEMLKSAVDIAGAQTGSVILADADGAGYHCAALVTREGELVPEGDELLQSRPMTADLKVWMKGMLREPEGCPLSPLDPLHSPEVAAFHFSQGNLALRHIPIDAGDRRIGWLGFGFSHPDPPFSRTHLLLEVLADQMAMAVEFSRLAELAENVEIAREQEKVARERAERLGKANEAIRSTLGRLIRTPEADTFVRFALSELCKHTHAVAAQVFRFSPTSNELRQICAVRNGEVFPDGHPDDPVEFQSGFNADVMSAYQRFREEGGVIWSPVDPPDPSTWPFLISWNRKMNHRAYAGIALLAGSRPLGFLALEFADAVSLTEIQSQLVMTFGLQISLALEITDLSEQSKHAAVAQEREKTERERAAELAKANRALKRSADRLASYPTTKAYLDAVLLEASVTVGARSAVIYEVDETGNWLFLTACAIDNEIVDVTLDPRLEIMRRRVETLSEGSALIELGKSRWHHLDTEAHLLWQFALPWHRQMGHRTLAVFPLLIGNRLIGRFGLGFTTEEPPSEAKLELCSTLSQHAALAMELNRLSDNAKQAAVQAEQEKAARDLAAELTNANAAMQRSVERLSALNDLGEFIVEVLKTVEEVTGAVGATVFLYDETSRTARVQAMVLGGQVRDLNSDPELLPFRDPIPLAGPELQTWERVFSSSGYHWSNVDDESQPSGTRAWHRARGHCTIVHYPLRHNTRRIGLLTLSFRERFPPVPARLDLVGVLAQQLILAIETARLGEDAKQAAVAFEREKAATERTAELARANASLRTTLDILAHESELSSFLRHVLAEAMQQLDARDGIVFVFNSEDGTLSPVYSVLDLSLQTVPLPYLNSSFPASQSGAWAALVKSRKPLVFEMERDEKLFVPEMMLWHGERGTRTVIGVPMFLGGEALGYFCLCLRRHGDGASAFALDQIQALVQQATLALQLGRLASAESKAAIAREQERAACQRAAELAQANEVMKRTGSRLLHASDPDGILRVIVSEACRTIGALECALFEYRPEHKDLVIISSVENGELRDTLPGHPHGDPAHPMPVEKYPAWHDLLARNQPFMNKATEIALAGHTVPGRHASGPFVILQSVLSMDNQPLGLFSLAFREERQPTHMELETFNILVQQATLALQMARLSKEAKSRAAEAATLEERNRIAREIHDTFAQSFMGVLMQIEAVDQLRVSKQYQRMDTHLQNAAAIARSGLAEARRSVKALRPSELESGSLIDAVKLVGRLAEQQSGASVVVQWDDTAIFQPAHSAEILRIVQEAITNAIRHAHATLITVSCRNDRANALLSILDNGVGFKPERKNEGFGLVGMRERAAKIGGELRINSGPDGSSIYLTIPLSRDSQ